MIVLSTILDNQLVKKRYIFCSTKEAIADFVATYGVNKSEITITRV